MGKSFNLYGPPLVRNKRRMGRRERERREKERGRHKDRSWRQEEEEVEKERKTQGKSQGLNIFLRPPCIRSLDSLVTCEL